VKRGRGDDVARHGGPERRLRAVPERREEDRRREALTFVFRSAWEHGVSGQAAIIQAMQKILVAYTVLHNAPELAEVLADIRYLVADGVREFEGMLRYLLQVQDALPLDTPADPEL
jgi:hypothetical protein